MPENIIIEGIIAEPEKLANILKKELQNPPWGEITAKRVVASLPESRSFTRIVELPILSNKELDEAINFEVEQSIPIPASDLYVDWQKIEEKNDKSLVFLAAAPRAIVDSYIQLFEILDIEPLAIEVSMTAIARSMISNKEKMEPVLIFDFGGQSTNIGVFDTALKISESYPVGGSTIKEIIASALSISIEKAAGLVEQGFTNKTKASELIRSKIEELLKETEKVLNYYSEKNGKREIKKALICGGLGFLPGLPEIFKQKLNLEAKVGNPWINISVYPIKPVPKKEIPGYAAAIGLAQRGLNDY